MTYNHKTKEELLISLGELKNTYDALKGLYEIKIADQTKAEKALIHSETRYRRLFESAKDGILILEANNGKILDVNPFLVELLGYSKKQFITKAIWELGFFRDIVANQEKFIELQQKEYVRYADLPLETAEGRKINVEFVSNVYIENSQKVIQCNIRDMTERKRAEEDLINAKKHAEESDRLKSAFLANMSHEIRTPMNGILGFAELLKEPELTGEQQKKYISIIEKSGARMLNIINDIICISKVDSGQMEIDLSETSINGQLEFIYNFFEDEAARKGIQLIYKDSLLAKDSIVKTDKEKLYAILTNLVKNAIKFTHDGSIEFGCKKKGNNLEFYVKDTGDGILPEQKEMIFERFRQGSDLISKNYEGTGLGLAISKAYVEMMGGKLRVESEPGIGSVFSFTIPGTLRKAAEHHHNNPDASNTCKSSIKNLKILIAEDDEPSVMLLEIAVKVFGRKLLRAHTGAEAVEICRNTPDIDLVLMDIRMPVMDGYEATRQIRKFNKKIVIIAQTAFAIVGDRNIAMTAGCNDYISKPFNQSQWKALIVRNFQSSIPTF